MFVAHDVAFGVPFATARPRLTDLVASRALVNASLAAYDEGLAHAGPGLPSPGRLMRVRSLQPAYGEARVTAGLRWEAAGPAAGLFPVLDADVTLAPADPWAAGWSWPASTVSRSLICTTIPGPRSPDGWPIRRSAPCSTRWRVI